MTDADRQRLAAILGMLGSEHAGERAAAGLQAEAFRKQHGMTWDQILAPLVIVVPAKPPPPKRPLFEPGDWRKIMLRACFYTAVAVGVMAIY